MMNSVNDKGHPAHENSSGSCCALVTHIDQLCPACLAQWEQWMEETALPQLRQAIAQQEAQRDAA